MSAASLRPATPEDHGLYTQFFAELGTPEGPLDPVRWQAEYAASSAFLVETGRDVGYAAWELLDRDVHVKHVVIAPLARRRGLGRTLMLELARKLRALGAQAWRLNVFSTNAAAIALYESLGLRTVHGTAALRIDWDRATQLRSSTARARDASADDDSLNEAKFGLHPGRLARARIKAGVSIVAATSPDGVCVGIAAFDPRIPGAFPFRTESAQHARSLLECLRERYRGESTFVQLVIEDDASLVRELETAGAQRLHDILHMAGPIPQ
jgi:GNAT superfamily N-acetyltransferase